MSAITVPATINLALSFVSSSQTGLDALTSIENVIGGSGTTRSRAVALPTVSTVGAGNDTIKAGAGDDIIIGGTGNDTMNGDAGNDIFIFGAEFGNDRVNGFDANPSGGQDRLDISALGITAATFASNVNITDLGSDTRVQIGADSILLVGVTGQGQNTITQLDFILA